MLHWVRVVWCCRGAQRHFRSRIFSAPLVYDVYCSTQVTACPYLLSFPRCVYQQQPAILRSSAATAGRVHLRFFGDAPRSSWRGGTPLQACALADRCVQEGLLRTTAVQIKTPHDDACFQCRDMSRLRGHKKTKQLTVPTSAEPVCASRLRVTPSTPNLESVSFAKVRGNTLDQWETERLRQAPSIRRGRYFSREFGGRKPTINAILDFRGLVC